MRTVSLSRPSFERTCEPDFFDPETDTAGQPRAEARGVRASEASRVIKGN